MGASSLVVEDEGSHRMHKLMTLDEFKADYSRETGVVDGEALDVLYGRYCEAESEAIASGKYDVDPAIEEARLAAIAAAKPFRVMIDMPVYCVHTDGLIGSRRWVAGGYDTREAAETARATMYMPDEAGSWVEPRERIALPVVAEFDVDECPF